MIVSLNDDHLFQKRSQQQDVQEERGRQPKHLKKQHQHETEDDIKKQLLMNPLKPNVMNHPVLPVMNHPVLP